MDRRRLLTKKARLPSAYQEVEWIRGTSATYNTNYIILNVSTQSKYACEICKFIVPSDIALNFDRIYSCGGKYIYFYSNSLMYSWRAGYNYYGLACQRDVPHTLKFNSTELYIDEELVNTFTDDAGWAENYDYRIMSGNDRDSRLKIIYFKLIDKNGIILREMIPCYRKSDGEIGMYDLIGKQFYTNQGTGTFEKGADV